MARAPAVFVGHGSPLNAIKSNEFTEAWAAIGSELPRPKAILAISAHWYLPEAPKVTAMEAPRTIHDFGRSFPQQLFDQQYASPGSPELARRVQALLSDLDGSGVALDDGWGLDHGTWAVLLKMYPAIDIPVVQLSIDSRKPAAWHYELGRRLSVLRDEGVLILGSGNVVHNFAEMDRERGAETTSYAWVEAWCAYVKGVVTDPTVDREDAASHPLVQWESHPLGRRANPSPDHWLPILYVLGGANATEPIRVVSEGYDAGSLAMMSIVVGS